MTRLILLLLPLWLVLSGCALNQATLNMALYHYRMGQSFYAENNFTEALVEFSAAEKLTPGDPALLNDLGLSYFRKGRYDLAEKKYLQAIALKPVYSEARNNLGVNYLEMQRWDDAIAQFRLVLNDIFFQGEEVANINLALAYLGRSDYPRALSLLRTAVGKNQADPRIRLHLGRVYFAMGETEMAIRQYHKALELNRSYAAAFYNLALAELKLNDSDLARIAFKEVIRLAPDAEIGRLSRENLDLH